MNKQSIYLKSISCKGIKSPIPFQKPSIYATVSLSATSQRHQTPVDSANGENPEWESPMRFNLDTPPSDGQDLLLNFDLTAQVPLIGNRLVGTAHVPVSDLIDGRSSGHVSYQVRGPDGKPNGTIQLWYQMEGGELPRDMADSSPQPSAPPVADFSYEPPAVPGPVYSATVPGTVPYNFPSVNTGPVCYPPMVGSATYNSESNNSGSVEPDRYGTPAGTEFIPYPPPPSSELYPPSNSGFESVSPYYPPTNTHNPPMDQAASGSTYYPPQGTHSLPMDHTVSGSAYYPPSGTHYPPMDYTVSGSTYYPPPMDRAQNGSPYYPPAGTRYPPVVEEPVVAYPPGNGYYPPPPRYPYY